MNREDLHKLIQSEIQSVAFEYLKDLNSKKKTQVTDDYLNSRSVTEEDIDSNLFYGGQPKIEEEKHKNKIAIQESRESNPAPAILKITVGEIKDFENSFKEILNNIPGASIVFDKQKNDYSIIATKRADGVEAKSSGILNLGDSGKITWSYSILSGFNLNAQNLKLDQNNKIMFETLFNHYNDWQKNWREKLNLPVDVEPEVDMSQNPIGNSAPGVSMAPEIGAAPATPAA